MWQWDVVGAANRCFSYWFKTREEPDATLYLFSFYTFDRAAYHECETDYRVQNYDNYQVQ